jgi:hypothetical protein
MAALNSLDDILSSGELLAAEDLFDEDDLADFAGALLQKSVNL